MRENAVGVTPASNRDQDSAPAPLWLRVCGRPFIAPIVLTVLAVLMVVPGVWQVPPLDRDEPRFAQATKQMVETGDYVDIRFQEEARHKKPVGIYWLQALAVEASGLGKEAPIWVYRLPSQIAAVLSVLLAYWVARAFLPARTAFLAGIFVALAIIVGVEARLAKTDAVLLATILAAQGALARIWIGSAAGRSWSLVFVFWTALAASVLIKGPVGLMVVGTTIAGICVIRRRVGWLKALAPLPGLLWFVLLVSPWFVAIWIATDGQFFQEAVGKDFVGKLASGQESHGAPPLTHLAAMLGTFWPLPAFLVLSLSKFRAIRGSDTALFALSWFLPSWLVFELVATKLPHYTMPLLPALAILAAFLLDSEKPSSFGKASRWAAAALYLIPVAGLAVASIVAPISLGIWPSPPGAVLAAFGLFFAIAAGRWLLNGRPLKAVAPAIAASLLVTVGTWSFTMPALTPIWVSGRLADAVRRAAPCEEPDVASAGFNEPSFIFLQGTRTRLVSGDEAADFLAPAFEETGPGNCRIAVVEKRQEQAFLDAIAAKGVTVRAVERVDGLNINGGKPLDIGVYSAGEASGG